MEVYKEIKGFDFTYLISNYGLVQKIENEKTKVLKIYDNGIGYKMVSMKKNNKYKLYYLHRLVAEYFLDNPYNLKEVNHIDFDKSNNKVCNIEWVSRKDNMHHYYKKFGTKTLSLNFSNNRLYRDSSNKITYLIDFYKPSNKWRLRSRSNTIRKHIGLYETYEIALDKQKSLYL
jgi:hypothetical protein